MKRSFTASPCWLGSIPYVAIAGLYALLCPSAASAQQTASAPEIVDQWRYTLERPPEDWTAAEFDDHAWEQGRGGFGTRGTPGARIGTRWNTEDIWLRKSFEVKSVPEQPALLVHHDENAEVYLNGQRVAAFEGWSSEYELDPLGAEGRKALRAGPNVLAVHCHQTSGGQFIDVHLVDAERVPKLPPYPRGSQPFQTELVTPWGEDVTAENAWTEYPRPQLRRENWRNLNGHWEYAVTLQRQQQRPSQWDGEILVPYGLESRLSGVQRLLAPSEALWYRRTFEVAPTEDRRTLLHFEAVDYRCEVFVNSHSVGSHQGGNTPFSFDITAAVQDGQNELVVRVEDDTEQWQLRGKQTLDPHAIWYTQVSGIWQTVWLEQVAPRYIEDLKITTDADTGTVNIRPRIAGAAGSNSVRVVVSDDGRTVAEAQKASGPLSIAIENAKLWSPNSPHLYDLNVALIDDSGNVIDQVESYAGIRSVGKTRDEQGHLRLTLNGDPIFHWGPLDQGWWPDGLLTPPSDEAMLFDIEYLKSAGFNMIRKHIKVEPRRYYYHCDRLGMLLWQDHVSDSHNPPWTRLEPNPTDARWPDEHHQQFMVELERMVDTLENHPSIAVWVPFNEAWSQHRSVDVGQWTVRRDPTRLVNIASGGNFWAVGDIADAHSYPQPSFPFDPERFGDFVKVIGEFGGHGYPVKGHLWDADRRNWGYGGLPQTKAEYKQRYVNSLELLKELQQRGIAAGVYTQTTDVEGEINGLMTYDRKVIKIPADELAELHKVLFTRNE